VDELRRKGGRKKTRTKSGEFKLEGIITAQGTREKMGFTGMQPLIALINISQVLSGNLRCSGRVEKSVNSHSFF